MTKTGERPALFETSYMVDQGNKRVNNRKMFPAVKNNATGGYKGSVKAELLKGAGLQRTAHFGPPQACQGCLAHSLLVCE